MPNARIEAFVGEPLRDAQGNTIENGGRKHVLLRVGREKKLVRATFRIANVKSPIL